MSQSFDGFIAHCKTVQIRSKVALGNVVEAEARDAPIALLPANVPELECCHLFAPNEETDRKDDPPKD